MLQRKISTLKRKFSSSIPILKLRNKQFGLSNRSFLTKHLRYVSSGIPLASICALLLLGVVLINPISAEMSFALEDGEDATSEISDERSKNEVTSRDLDNTNVELEEADHEETENSSNDDHSEDLALSKTNANDSGEDDYDIITLADSTLSLTVTSPTLSTNANPGQTAYVSSNVTYGASNITEYQL